MDLMAFDSSFFTSTVTFQAASSAVDSHGGPAPSLSGTTGLAAYVEESTTNIEVREGADAPSRSMKRINVITTTQPTVVDGPTRALQRLDVGLWTPAGAVAGLKIAVIGASTPSSDCGRLWKTECELTS